MEVHERVSQIQESEGTQRQYYNEGSKQNLIEKYQLNRFPYKEMPLFQQ